MRSSRQPNWPGANLCSVPGRRRPSASVGSPAKASSKSSLLRNVDVELDISCTHEPAAQRCAPDMDFELVAPDKSWRWHIIEMSMASFLGRYVDHTV
jgi:hypothetical protein